MAFSACIFDENDKNHFFELFRNIKIDQREMFAYFIITMIIVQVNRLQLPYGCSLFIVNPTFRLDTLNFHNKAHAEFRKSDFF